MVFIICIIFATEMKRMMFLYAFCMVVNMLYGQRTCVVADMFTHIPIGM